MQFQVTEYVVKGKTFKRVQFWCPGCDQLHEINTEIWTWKEAEITVHASILVRYGAPKAGIVQKRCHSFLEKGKWRFLEDCYHELAGQKDIEMIDLPDWVID